MIVNNYDVSGFDGTKTFVVATTNALGGKNQFLGACYLLVGVLCGVMAIIFGGVKCARGRDESKKQ